MLSAMQQVLDSAAFVMGPNVRAFEAEMAAFCGVRQAIGVASGTDALTLSLRALGIEPGDEVLVPSFTYAATAAAVCHLGAKPVFVDSLPNGFNLDPDDAGRRVTRKTRAIIPVHLYGEAAPMKRVMELADAHHLFVVEDVAQATGGKIGNRVLGSLGTAGCFSFYPTKNLGGCGDGGMITTNDDEVAARVRLLRQQADASVAGGEKYLHPEVGYNSRLDELQAALLRVKLPHLAGWNAQRIRNAASYESLLREAGIGLPAARRDGSHVYCLYTLRCQFRDGLRRHLSRRGIGTAVYYPLPLHLQEAYRGLGYREGDLPVSEELAKQVLSIPSYPELTLPQIETVAGAVVEFAEQDTEITAEEVTADEL
jgi:dTDP-4-amino-4,6-dideoxygalactose transaminase